MASLTVWKFGTPFGADAALEKMKLLQEQQLIVARDAAVVSWAAGDAVLNRVAPEFAGSGAELISTNMPDDQEARLRAAFQQED